MVTITRPSLDLNDTQVGLVSLATGEFTPLFQGTFARYSPSGHIVYWRDDSLWAVPFDIGEHRIVGAETPVVEGVQAFTNSGMAAFGLSATGTLVYSPGSTVVGFRNNPRAPGTLVWVNRNGEEEPLVGLTHRPYGSPRLSPDERQLVVDEVGGDIWLYDLKTQNERQLTFSGNDQWPVWSPDGSEIVFTSSRDGSPNLYSMALDLSGGVTRLTESQGIQNACLVVS